MSDQSIAEYIKQNLAAGFSEEEIRLALKQADWSSLDIDEGFFEAKGQKSAPRNLIDKKPVPATPSPSRSFLAANKQKVITILLVLASLPALALGGFLLYQRYESSSVSENTAPDEEAGQIQGTQTADPSRDQKRLEDTAALRQALEIYFQRNLVYPANISALAEAGVISQIPRDPKTNDPYLYRALGEPAFYYFIAVFLETEIEGEGPGLKVFYSDQEISPEVLSQYQEFISSAPTEASAAELDITDLTLKPFRPEEPVVLEIRPAAALELVSATLIIPGYLEQTDQSQPFGFRFLAPRHEGEYEVFVFGFDENHNGHLRKTKFSVQKP